MDYDEVYKRSLSCPDQFWSEAANAVDWSRRWDSVLDDTEAPFYRWFAGGELNSCHNALDRHVDSGRGNQAALIYDSPSTGVKEQYTYSQLRDEVAKFAGVLAGLGVNRGDRVLIYMPMVPEAVIAILACARIGAVHSVVFGGFAANELALRIDDARPGVIVAASCGIEPNRIVSYKPLLDEAIELSTHELRACIVLQRDEERARLMEGRDFDWHQMMAKAVPAPCTPVAATDPLYILYTSGTTGKPKGVVRDNGGHAVSLQWSMKYIYGVEPGDVFWAASDIGWVVGHSYIIYGPLFHGCTTILYEGKAVGTPDPGAYWRVISEYGVKVLFTAPTAFRAIKRDDPDGKYLEKYDLGGFRHLFLAGERCDPDTLEWAAAKLNVPVIDHWWQTETGWPIAANPLGIELLPIKPGSPARSMPGYRVQVLDETGKEAPAGEIGNIVIKLPLPPGCLPTLWQNDQGFVSSYLQRYPGYYLTGDAGFKDGDDYLWIMSRIDDVINVAGHRLSTGAIEEAIASHPDVAECAVFGVADPLKGEVPMGLLVLQSGVSRDHDLIISETIQLVRDRIGPVAAFKSAVVVARLPKTRSGKILRGTMREIANGGQYQVPATIDEPTILDEISRALQKVGYPRAES